ncbi:MAG: sigma-54 interaction domain-containing protein, partial [Rubricoccaceae bacterium]
MERQVIQERFGILGSSPALLRMLDRVRNVAPADITVLLEGESGVGKELIATAIHGLSERRRHRLVVVNCGAIPEGLIESELFGAEKGAYTGAVERRTGYFEEAHGGTLFLDEIGEMPLQAQVRLLRVLETGQYSRVGSSQTQHADVRVVAATNKDLGEEVRSGSFREDLYYRLSSVVVRVPPLRERVADIVPLFDAFRTRFTQQYRATAARLTPDALGLLQRYTWPGNVRELRNVAEQTVVLLRESQITAEHIRPLLRGVSASAGLALARKPSELGRPGEDGLYRALWEMRMELAEMRALLQRATGALGGTGSRPRAPIQPPPSPPTVRPEAEPTGDGPLYRDVGSDHEVAYEPPDDLYPVPEAADTPFFIEPSGKPSGHTPSG